MVQVAGHLGVAELQARWRESKDATLARHYQVIWLVAEGRSCAEVAGLTGFVRRWVEELVVRYNRFGPSSLGDRRRGNGAKPQILTPEVLAMLSERVKTPPDDGGVWTAKKVALVMAMALGLASVWRGWPNSAAGRPCARSAGRSSARAPGTRRQRRPKRSRRSKKACRGGRRRG